MERLRRRVLAGWGRTQARKRAEEQARRQLGTSGAAPAAHPHETSSFRSATRDQVRGA